MNRRVFRVSIEDSWSREITFLRMEKREVWQGEQMALKLFVSSLVIGGLLSWPTFAGDVPTATVKTFPAVDTLAIGEESVDDARMCLKNLTWPAGEFEVTIDEQRHSRDEDLRVRFPSPVPSRNKAADLVVMEWYRADTSGGENEKTPAVVVVHESGSGMTVGRMIAKGFRQRGVHAFLVQLPGYGERRSENIQRGTFILEGMRQGIVDVRRARDAVAALPSVDSSRIALQGTSLGGFVSANVIGLDQGYDRAFLMLAGGDIFSVLKNGQREAEKVRELLSKAGYSDEEIREIAWQVEPNRLAHRIDPSRTWLYSGVFDSVVPIENARTFAKAARLPQNHHILMPVNHYTGIVLLPAILDQMADLILSGQ